MPVLIQVSDVKHVEVDIPSVLSINWERSPNIKIIPPADGETEEQYDMIAGGAVSGVIFCRDTSGPKAADAITTAGVLTASGVPQGGGAAVDVTFGGCVFAGNRANVPRANVQAVSEFQIPFRAKDVTWPM